MRPMQLTFKVFIVFLVTLSIVLLLTVLNLRWSVRSNFLNYINQVEKSGLSSMVVNLQSFYEYHGKITNTPWESLKEDRRLWHRFMGDSFRPVVESNTLSGAGMRPFGPGRRPPPPPGSPNDEADRLSFHPRQGPGFQTQSTAADDEHADHRNRPPPPHTPRDPIGLAGRLALFDADKIQVMGRSVTFNESLSTPIQSQGKTVAWLMLDERRAIHDPNQSRFINEINNSLYSIVFIVFISAVIVSYLGSRYLLLPIRQLIKGTQQAARGDYSHRIDIRSSDELGQLANSFNTMAESLAHSETLRRQWIADIAHELRTPLTILKGELHAIQDGVREWNDKTIISLSQEVDGLEGIVTDLHDLTVSDLGELSINESFVDVVVLVDEKIERQSSIFAEKGIEVTLSQQGESSRELYVDPVRIRQLINNLVSNTLRYTDSPGVLDISFHWREHSLLMLWQDSAPGVPMDICQNLFERLYRYDESRNRAVGGSGLGLAICKAIVEAHGGTINASQSAYGGICFSIELPYDA